MNTRPRTSKSASLASLGAIATWLLLNLMRRIGHPSSVDPSALIAWWGDAGTPAAAVFITGAAGVIIGAYLTVIGFFAAAIGAVEIANRIPRLDSIWAAVSTDSLRRILAAGLVTIYVSGPSLASAAGQPPPIVLVDLGLDGGESPQIVEVAATPEDHVEVTALGDERNPSIPTSDTWTVAPGDHLWHIAERVLERSGISPSERSTSRYWRRLIADNRSTIGSDPDLIFPGQVLRLPTL